MACSGTALALCLHIVTSGLFNEGSVQDGLLLHTVIHHLQLSLINSSHLNVRIRARYATLRDRTPQRSLPVAC
jgi:hypothetical protein